MFGYTLCSLLMIELLLAFWEVEWMYRTGGFVLVVLSTVTLLFTAYGIVTRVQTSKWGF